MIARIALAPALGLALVSAHSSAFWLSSGDGALQPVAGPACTNTLVARLPDTATGMGAVVEGGWLYLLGGHRGEPHHYAAEFQSSDFVRLDLADLSTFERLPGLIQGVQGAQLAARAGGVYRCGGMRALNADGEESQLVSIDEFARFDTRTLAWTALPSLPARRSSHAAVLCADDLVVVGGWDLAGPLGRASTFHGETWLCDLSADQPQWRSLPTPFTRRALGIAALEGRVVAVGGMDEQGRPSARVDVLDVAQAQWSRGPDLPEGGFGVAAVASAGRVFASAGSGTLWSWAPGEAAWRAEGQQLFGRLFHQLVARAEGDLLAVGGTCSGAQVRAVERLTLAEPQLGPERGRPREASVALSAPALHSTSLRLASPGRARNRQAAALVQDRLLLFGGNSSLGQHDFAPENFLDEGWALDLRSLEWGSLAALPVARQSVQTAELAGGVLLAVGGFGHDGEATRTFPEVFRYSTEADVWRSAPPLPVGRSQFALVGDEHELWILGGLDYVKGRAGGGDFVHTTAVLKFDAARAAEARFEAVEVELPTGRRAFGCATLARQAYLVGGLRDGFETVEECLVFDLDQQRFEDLPAPRRARVSPELVELAGRLYLVGGSSRDEAGELGPDPSIEVYDPASGTWSVLTEDCGVEPAHLRAFAHRGRLLLVSTQQPESGGVVLAWLDPR